MIHEPAGERVQLGRAARERVPRSALARTRAGAWWKAQRMVQAQSDLFLGWTEGAEGRHFHVRQLRDGKGSVEVEGASADQLRSYAALCGRTLARGHARPVAQQPEGER